MIAFFAGPIGRWILIAAMIAAAMGWSYTKGIERESDRRDALEFAQIKADVSWTAAMVAIGQKRIKELQAAVEVAKTNYRNLKGSIANAKPSTLVACPPANNNGNAGNAPDSVSPLFTTRFVGLWNSAWTGQGGESLFPYRTGSEEAPITASPVTVNAILDNHADNADACSGDRRTLNRLIDRIEELEREWNARSP